MPMYNLIECSYNYLETFGRLWQHYIGKSVLTDADAAYNFLVYSVLFRSKQKITDATGAGCTKILK